MGIIFQSDIERDGMCKEDPAQECTAFCSKFIKRECPGMRYIRTNPKLWTDQKKYPFSLYAELTNNGDKEDA